VTSTPRHAAYALVAIPAVSAVQGAVTTWSAANDLSQAELASFTSFWAIGISFSVVLIAGLEMAGLRNLAARQNSSQQLRFYVVAAPLLLSLLVTLTITTILGNAQFERLNFLVVLLLINQMVFVAVRVRLIGSERYQTLAAIHVLQFIPLAGLITLRYGGDLRDVPLDECLFAQLSGWLLINVLGRIGPSFERQWPQKTSVRHYLNRGKQEPTRDSSWGSPASKPRAWLRRPNSSEKIALTTATGFSALTVSEALPFSIPLFQGNSNTEETSLVAFFALYVIFARGVTTLVNSQAPRFTRQIGEAAYRSTENKSVYYAANSEFSSIWSRIAPITVGAHVLAGTVLIPVLTVLTDAPIRNATVVSALIGLGEILLLRTSLLRITLGMVAAQRRLLAVAVKMFCVSIPLGVLTVVGDFPFMFEYVAVPYGLIAFYSLVLNRTRKALLSPELAN